MDNYDNYGNWFPGFLIYSIIALVSASPPIFACSNGFLGFSFVLVVKVGIDGVAAGFDQELALEAKPQPLHQRDEVSTRTNGFYLFLLKVNR